MRGTPTLAGCTLAVALIATGCGSGSEESAATDVEEVRTIEVGEVAEADNGVSVTITDLAVDGAGPWLEASVRYSNPNGEATHMPDTRIICEGSDEFGAYVHTSTVTPTEDLPARSFREGVVDLVVPGFTGSGKPAPTCRTPAFVQFGPPVHDAGGTTMVRVRIPDRLMADLNGAG